MFNSLNGMDDRRNAWIFTCDRWADHGCYIVLPVNPETLSISMALRSREETTKRGKVVYVSRNQRNDSLFKSPEIQFTISSGNITPEFNREFIDASTKNSGQSFDQNAPAVDVRRISKYTAKKPGNLADMKDRITGTQFQSVASRPGMNIPNLYSKLTPVGVQNLYAFLMLADEQKFYNDVPNKIRIHINSLLFPSMYLRCTFTEQGISWSESADDPGQFTMNFTLKVIGSSPKIGYKKLNEFFDLYTSALQDAQQSYSVSRIESQLNRQTKPVSFESVSTSRASLAGINNSLDVNRQTIRDAGGR